MQSYESEEQSRVDSTIDCLQKIKLLREEIKALKLRIKDNMASPELLKATIKARKQFKRRVAAMQEKEKQDKSL